MIGQLMTLITRDDDIYPKIFGSTQKILAAITFFG